MGEAHKMITAVAVNKTCTGNGNHRECNKKITNDNQSQRLFDLTTSVAVHTGCRAAMEKGVLRNPHWLSAASGKEGAGRGRP